MEGRFGRRIIVTFTPTSWNQKTGSSKVDNEHSVTIAYDVKSNINLCSRIDFFTRTLGPSYITTSRCASQIAKIDIWNIGSELNQMFNAYNNPNKSEEWNPFEIKKWSVDLQVGYDDGSFERIFAGTVSSYYFERVQTEENVDNVFHFLCWYPRFDMKTLGQKKGQSGIDYLDPKNREYLTNIDNYKTTLESYIWKIVMDRPRDVWEVNVAQSMWEGAKDFLTHGGVTTALNTLKLIGGDPEAKDRNLVLTEKKVMLGYSDDAESDPPVEDVSKYFGIKYDSDETANFFRNTVIFDQPLGDTSNLLECLNKFVKKYGYKITIERLYGSGGQMIYIDRGSNAPGSSFKLSSSTWEIVNFQNMIKSPEVSLKNMYLTILLEPSIKPLDRIVLKVTDDFMAQNRPSFSPNVDTNDIVQFAGTNAMGFAEFSKKQRDITDQKSYGNIFNRQYSVLCVEHQGSSHESMWQTRIECIATIGE